MDANGSNVTQLTSNPDWEFVPSWSPDGTKIAYTKNTFSLQSLWIMNANGTNQTQCLTSAGGSNPDWSPDGSKLVFGIGAGSSLDLYSSSAGCTGVTQLTSATGEDNLASWSPGGSEIAFTTNRNGSNEVWIMNQDGSGQHFLTSGGGAGVDWQPIPDPDGDGILPPADICPQSYGPPPDGCPPPGPAVVGGIAGLVSDNPARPQASPSGDGSRLPLAAVLSALGAFALIAPAMYLRRRTARR